MIEVVCEYGSQLDGVNYHCVKGFRIRSYSGLYFPAFRLNTERYGVYLSILSPNVGKCGPE